MVICSITNSVAGKTHGTPDMIQSDLKSRAPSIDFKNSGSALQGWQAKLTAGTNDDNSMEANVTLLVPTVNLAYTLCSAAIAGCIIHSVVWKVTKFSWPSAYQRCYVPNYILSI